jgi:hypothetical protein
MSDNRAAIAAVVSIPRRVVTPIRTKYAGSWDVGRESGIPVRMSRRPNAFQQFVAKHVLGFEWIDAE